MGGDLIYTRTERRIQAPPPVGFGAFLISDIVAEN